MKVEIVVDDKADDLRVLESIERKCFVYTSDEVYESDLVSMS